MSLTSPHTEIRLFNVSWQPNDNNWLKFADIESQTTSFNDYVNGLSSSRKYIGTDFNIIKNGVVVLPTNSYNINKYNYMMFKNPDISAIKTWWYAYIDRVEWLSYNSCAVHFTLDAWQNYQFNISFKKCFIERSHVPQSDATESQRNGWKKDRLGNYLAPEPVSVTPQYERSINDFSSTGGDNPNALDWSPTWVLHSTSKPISNNGKIEYEYSGTGSGGTLTAEYGKFVSSTSDIQSIVESYGRKSMEDVLAQYGSATTTMWENITNWISDLTDPNASYTHEWQAIQGAVSLAEVQDHRNELIGLYAIPTWLKGNSSGYASNDVKTKSVNVTLDQSTLACLKNGSPYEPRNKKMLTSMCKGYCIYTANGFKVALKPELFTDSTPIIDLIGSQMATDGIMIHINGYNNPSNAWHKLNYSCQSRLGYDANTGLDKTLNQLSTMIGAVGTVANIGASAGAGNWMGVLSGVGSAVSGATNMIDAIGQRGVNTGASGNLISITGGRPVPKLVDLSPNLAECEYIDDYLDVYGYAIEEILSVNIDSRPSWNYIKVAKLNAKIDAPDEFASVIKNAFESGVHIWHTSITNVGNFGLSNVFDNTPTP